MTNTLYDLFESSFPADRSRPFLEVPGGRTWSYADLENETARLARVLRNAGATKGERVAAQVEKSPEAILVYLACVRAGAAYLPLNTGYQAAEIEYFMGDAEPAVIVCRPPDAERMSGLTGDATVLTLGSDGGGTLMELAAQEPPAFETVAAGPEDLAAILYTSGTTGRSKGAMMSHQNLASNAATLRRLWGFTGQNVLLHALPIYHTHGLFVATNCVLASGSRMLFMPRFDAQAAIGLLPRATVFMGVPTLYVRMLAEAGLNANAVRNMRLFISGSAPLLEETFHQFEARTGHTILERYGMTEAGMLTSNPLDGERRPGTVGPPLPDVEARFVDDDGNKLGAAETGVLEVRGPNVFAGYWRQPEKTAAEFRDDSFFVTGDLAQISADGYVSIVGRTKDLIISGGLNVYPKEVEAAIDAIEGVGESAVIGVAHPDFGEAVTAVVTRADANLSEQTIIDGLSNALAKFKMPKSVHFVDELPRNAMGKVQKNELRKRYDGLYKSGGAESRRGNDYGQY